MRFPVITIGITLVMLGAATMAPAADLKDKVSVKIESVGLHPDMPPGMYVCAGGHLHIKGVVQNLTGVELGKITVAGKAYDPDGKLLGTATASTKEAALLPEATAPINLEFLTVTGPLIQRATRHDLSVVEAHRKR